MHRQLCELLVDVARWSEQERSQVALLKLLNIVKAHIKLLSFCEKTLISLAVQNISQESFKAWCVHFDSNLVELFELLDVLFNCFKGLGDNLLHFVLQNFDQDGENRRVELLDIFSAIEYFGHL